MHVKLLITCPISRKLGTASLKCGFQKSNQPINSNQINRQFCTYLLDIPTSFHFTGTAYSMALANL